MVLNLYPELSIIVITSTLHKVLDLHTHFNICEKILGHVFFLPLLFFAIIADSVHNMEDGGVDRSVIDCLQHQLGQNKLINIKAF